MHVDISGKVVAITGAGRGIGEVLARRFAAETGRIALLERFEDRLARVAEDVGRVAVQVLPLVCDVSQEDAVHRAVEAIVGTFGRVDILINNAGIAPDRTIETMTVDEWDQVFAINARGVFLCARAVLPHMKQAGRGRILNASSFAAIIPSYGFSAYSASKSAVVTFTRVLAAEVGPWGITANSYAPGMVPTPLNEFAQAPEEKQERLLNTLALRRWQTGDDVASLLIFLASDHAAYITGASFDVTGGKFAVQFPQLAYQAR